MSSPFSIPPVTASHVLVVEDDEDMLAYIQSILVNSFRVSLASNGREAVEILCNHQIDLVISDIGMPEMDGYNLLQYVRDETEPGDVPFLMLTVHSGKPQILAALRLGVDGYVAKPFDREELLARVENLLKNYLLRKKNARQYSIQTGLSGDIKNVKPFWTQPSYREKWLIQLEQIISTNLHDPDLKIQTLASQLSISERTLRNRIREFTGLSPMQYIQEARLNRALHLLEKKSFRTVAEVAFAVGLNSAGYLSRLFKVRYGKSPAEYLQPNTLR